MRGLFDALETEVIVKAADSRYKKLGQFFTPEPVAQLVKKCLERTFYESPLITVLDPAAGEGSLLRPLLQEARFRTFALEIDPGLRGKLRISANHVFITDAVPVMVELAKTPHPQLLPLDAIVMNPPYNIQVGVPPEASDFLSVKEEYGTGRYKAKAEEFFLEAALRTLRSEVYWKQSKRVVISIHTRNHEQFLRKVVDELAKEKIKLNVVIYPLGKAFKEVNQEFIILFASQKPFHELPSIREVSTEKEFLDWVGKLVRVIPKDEEKEKNLARLLRSLTSEKIEVKTEEIIPRIKIINGKIKAEDNPLLDFYSRFMELIHPVLDEPIDLKEALQTWLLTEIVKDPILGNYFEVKGKIPTPEELVSLSPPTPLQILAFVERGLYRAEKDLMDDLGNIVIEKGKVYEIVPKVVKRKKEIKIDENTKKIISYQTKLLQIISPESGEIILEVEV